MKFTVATVLTALLGLIGGLQFGWWIIAVGAFLTAILVHQKAGKAFIAGFLGIFLLWLILASWMNSKNEGILAGKIAQLLGIGNHPAGLILITALIGGLVAGFAAMSGSYLRKTN